VISWDIVKDNVQQLSERAKGPIDGIFTFNADASGRVGTSGSPYILTVGTDPDTGLRRWKVTPQESGSLPANLERAIEKLDGPSAQIGQIVKLLNSGDRITQDPETGEWSLFNDWSRHGFVPGQLGYEIWSVSRATPPRKQVGQYYVFSETRGWRLVRDPAVPVVLIRALEVIDAKLAREFEAKQIAAKDAGRDQFLKAVMREPATPMQCLPDSEIQANARAVLGEIDYAEEDSTVLFQSPLMRPDALV
jgi:hypothetical protein